MRNAIDNANLCAFYIYRSTRRRSYRLIYLKTEIYDYPLFWGEN